MKGLSIIIFLLILNMCGENMIADGNTYLESKMKKNPSEFYAEAFNAYFCSLDSRAALPTDVREVIDKQLEDAYGAYQINEVS